MEHNSCVKGLAAPGQQSRQAIEAVPKSEVETEAYFEADCTLVTEVINTHLVIKR